MITKNNIVTVQSSEGSFNGIVTGPPKVYGGPGQKVKRYFPVLRFDNKSINEISAELITDISTEFPFEIGDTVRLPVHGVALIEFISPSDVTLSFMRRENIRGLVEQQTTIAKWRLFSG